MAPIVTRLVEHVLGEFSILMGIDTLLSAGSDASLF